LQNIKIKYIFVKEYKNKINNSDKKDEQESKEISMYDVRSGM